MISMKQKQMQRNIENRNLGLVKNVIYINGNDAKSPNRWAYAPFFKLLNSPITLNDPKIPDGTNIDIGYWKHQICQMQK